MKKNKAINTSLNIIYFLIFVSVVYQFFQNIKSNFPPEFFITYDGGFIRRGFVGSVLYEICRLLDLDAVRFVLWFVWVLIFINVVIITRAVIKARIGWFFMMTSPMMLNILSKNIPCRLDLVIIPLFILQMAILKTNRISISLKLIITSFLMCLGVVIHEIYIIISLFSFIYILKYFLNQKNIKTYLLVFLPSIAVFVIISFFFKGNLLQIENAIHEWKNFGLDLSRLDYLRWLYSQNGTIFLWNNTNFVNNPIIWGGFFVNYIIICCLYFRFLQLNYTLNQNRLLIFFNFGIILFLCFIAEDFIRWFYMMSLMTLLYFIIFEKKKETIIIDSNYLSLKFIFLFVGVPMVGTWSFYLFFWTTPIRNLVTYYYLMS